MKKYFLLGCFFLVQLAGIAQSIPKKVITKAKNRFDTRVDVTIDKGLDKVEEGVDKTGKTIINGKEKKNAPDAGSTKQNNPGTGPNADRVPASDTSKPVSQVGFSDFVPGSDILFSDNFEKDALGDFPAGWNTNGSGQIVIMEGNETKWLDIKHSSIVHPILKKVLPENFTVEFDLFLKKEGQRRTPLIHFGLTAVNNVLKEYLPYAERFYTGIWHYNSENEKHIEYGFKDPAGTKNDFPIVSYTNKILHVSVAVNKTRIRVYFDQTKIIDLPIAITDKMRRNFYFSNVNVIPASEIGVFIANIRIASGTTDARSLIVKDLLEKGTASTNEILFDVNKDIIKRESFRIINEIGEALKTNPSLRIKIVGHTDSDGKAADNLSLSKRRAEAVAGYLINNFGIEDSRISTDGKGASVPVSDNKTPDGKAKNRRVEFIKQ
jgi:outer membrane protein OmpA-like peptidoglycan-associated protein